VAGMSGAARLDWHHEPPFRELPEAPAWVRVPGLGTRIRLPHRRAQRMAACAVLVLGVAVTAAATAGLLNAVHHPRYVLAAAHAPARPLPAPHGPRAVAPPQAAAQRVPLPVSLTIPAIGVRTRLIRLGLTRSGTLRPPHTTKVAGWFTGSPAPGATGSSVIAGHVDSYLGPGVFFRLRLLSRGDRIYVRQAGGRVAVFRVSAVRRYAKARFPTPAVYGAAPTPQLRLITCGGTFDPAVGSYLSNIVVYATMVRG
jgi:sortase (surface protein transpeptidase)